MTSGMKRAGDMWVRSEDTFMPSYFERTGDEFEIDHLRAALEHCAGRKLALDVGAHYGSWTRHLARQFEQVLAFEPITETFACLAENTGDFHNARVFQKAVGETSRLVSVGVGKMYQHPGMETVNAASGDVEMISIDQLALSALDFLKIDVEGYELHVLHGAERTLKQFRPLIIFEENIRGPLEHGIENGECAAYLNELGAQEVCVLNKDHVFKWS